MTRAKDISKIVTDADLSGTLEVTKGASGATANAAADELILQNSGDAGLSILSPNANNSQILLGSPVANAGGIIRWTGDDNAVKIGTNNTGSTLRFHVGGFSEVMRISSAGNVGIGTSSPATKLDIIFDADSGIKFDTISGAAGTLITSYHGTNNSNVRTLEINCQNFQVETGDPTGTATTERMRIDSNGSITSTAASGNMASFASSTNAVEFKILSPTANVVRLDTGTSDVLAFAPAGTERMRIDSGGHLLLNTTTERNSGNLSIDYAGTSQAGIGINDTSSANASPFIGFLTGGTFRGSITNNNNTAVAYNTTSDHRLKENVTADWDATTRLKQLNPVRFNFIADADRTVDGFLAHEVQSVVPEAITGTHNEVDADGNPVYQGIDQSKLVPLLVKTIQELEARIVALETA